MTWKREFEAELRVQKLDRVVAPDFDPRALQDSCDSKLHAQQNAYLWTVLLRVFENDMGQLCLSDHVETRNA